MNPLQENLPKVCSPLQDWFTTTKQLSKTNVESVWGEFIVEQDKINQELVDFLPQAIHAMHEGANDFLEMLQEDKRYEIILSLLKKNDRSCAPVLIQKLKAIPGVIQAVQDYLIEILHISGKIPFTEAEVKQMFEGRFDKFFPQSRYNLSPSIQHLHFALLTLKDQNIDNTLCESYRYSNGEVNILGYSYPIAIMVLTNQLKDSDGFFVKDGVIYEKRRGKDYIVPEEILRSYEKDLLSIIALGFYHRQGHSTFPDKLGRGMTQFERDIPELHAAIESLIQTSAIAGRMSRLYRRLLAENWGYHNTNGHNISGIRFLAEELGEALPDFWALRVEIHNLPTPRLLEQVIEYARNFKGSDQHKADLNRLISYMKDFLNSNTQETTIETWEDLARLREANHQAPENIANFLADSAYRDIVLRFGGEELEKIEQQSEVSAIFQASLNLAEKLIDQVVLDDMLSVETASRYKSEMVSLAQDELLSLDRRIELVCALLENLIDQVRTPLQAHLAEFDAILSHLSTKEKTPLKFVDSLIRSHTIFLVGKLVDHLSSVLLSERKLAHKVEDKEFQAPVEVLNPGVAEGVLRINKNPMEMASNEIGVFSETPFETAPVQGIITLGAVARLSHLQLLAKGLQIPSIKVSAHYMEALQKLEGKKVRFTASKEKGFELKACEEDELAKPRSSVQIPPPDHSIESPIAFSAVEPKIGLIAGPKGMNLARMFNSKELGDLVPDGFILPFGFFRKYIKHIGIESHLETFSQLKLKNRLLVLDLAKQIQAHILANPIPSEMLQEVETSLTALKQRTNSEEGFFFRSDTNVEDLPNFNGAGLNKTIPNVKPNAKEIDEAIREVWISPFTEKSIYWRARAVSSDRALLAEPSVVVMPTVKAESSGVLLSRGGPGWELKKGTLSADFGIGSVVESSNAVEEVTFESKLQPHRFAFSVASMKPIADSTAERLASQSIQPGKPVLQDDALKQLKKLSKVVEQVLGEQSHGWDIEWAFNENNQLKVLQARPNM